MPPIVDNYTEAENKKYDLIIQIQDLYNNKDCKYHRKAVERVRRNHNIIKIHRGWEQEKTKMLCHQERDFQLSLDERRIDRDSLPKTLGEIQCSPRVGKM